MKKFLFILFFLFICSISRAEKSKEIEIECALCHIERLTKDNSLIEKQNINSADSQMCYSCHDGSIRDSRNSIIVKSHSTIITPSSQISVSNNLPLNKDKKIYCGTCHRPHGVSKKKIEEPGFFRIPPEALCQSCHINKTGEIAINHIFKQKPEKDTGFNAKGCPACHIIHSAPAPAAAAAKKEKPILCLTCHPDKDKLRNTPHNLINSAAGEKNILGKTAEESGLCGPCHLVHNGNTFMLWAKPLDPEKEKNPTLLCATCHANDKCASKKQIGEIYHPVDINLIFIPQTQKRLTLLRNNSLTCTTCHDPHFEKKNFLRMENNQAELCIECHPEQKTVAGTKHDISTSLSNIKNSLGQQITETGACAGCHLVHNASDIKLWAKTITPQNDLISTLCYSCHNENDIAKNKLTGNHSHSLNIPILKFNLTTTLPLFTQDGLQLVSGNITCATCHNVHQWDPVNIEEKQTNEGGTGKNSFLRKSSNLNSELCSDCHKKESFIAKSNHDMTIIAPYSVNKQKNTIEASGICSACHLMHNAADSTKWAQELPEQGSLKEKLCLSCHNQNGMAKDSLVGPNSHPLNKPIAGNTVIRLPVYNTDGIIDRNGLMTCMTCHEPHLWNPEYFAKQEAKTGAEEETQVKEKFTDDQVDSSHIGSVALIQGDYIYINLKEDYVTEIGRTFSIIDDENVTISKVTVEKYNPYAKTFKAFAKILSPESIPDIQEGDYIIDISLFLKAKIARGTGQNSFLRISNNSSFLCLECHSKERAILGSKHDLSINAPAEQNIQGNTTLESGPCASCHLAHNGMNAFLSAKNLKEQNPDPSSGICFTCHVKEGIASVKEIKYEWHHSAELMPSNKLTMKIPAIPMPFFDIDGSVRYDSGLISCGTCHYPHQWDPGNAENISNEEGNMQNSFLRIKNTANQLCNECHLSPVKKIMNISDYESSKATGPEEEIADFGGADGFIILTAEITSPANNQVVNNPEHVIQGTISDTTVTTATLILNEESLLLEVKDGIFSNKIKFREGKNTLKITVTDKKGQSASSPSLDVTLDSSPLKILSYVYPKPVKVSNEFKIKFIFNKTIDINYPPVITLIGNGRTNPFVEKGGEITATNLPDDTYMTPEILLDEGMAGEITIVVSDVHDPAGNVIKKVAEESFILKPDKGFNLDKQESIIIEEGNITFSPQINIKFDITEAEEMMITEDVTFKASQWQVFKPSKTFPLSNIEGEKIIYFKFKDKFGNISAPVTKICTFVLPQAKQNIPRLIFSDLTLTKENSPYYLRGEITVGSEATLTIQPGVKLLFSELKKRLIREGKEISEIEKPALIIEGSLIVHGEKDKEIEFNVQSAAPQPGDWEGIIIKGSSSNRENTFEFCNIYFANIGLRLDNSKVIIKNSIFSKNNTAVSIINNSSIEIEASKIENNKNEAILLSKSKGNINKNEIIGNKVGILCDDVSNPSIANNYIMKNETGINCQGGSSPQIANNTIMENINTGIIISFFSSPAIVGNLIAKNTKEGIHIIESSPLIYKNLIRDNKTGIFCEKFNRQFLTQNNSIFNNKEFNFYLKNFNADLDISNNWWGTDKSNFIELYFFDKNSDETLGQLNYKPMLLAPIFSEAEGVLALIDTQKPVIEKVFMPKTARISPNFKIKLELNESVNPYILPILYFKNLSNGITPLVINNNWVFFDGKYSNNIILTPDIYLDTTMSGTNEVFIGYIQDLSGNIIDSTKIGVFDLKTNIGIKEGENTNKKEINIVFNDPYAKEIQVSENPSFNNTEWLKYTELLPFILSETVGNKKIYIRFKDAQNNISSVEELTINYDNMPPEIIGHKIPEDIKILRSFRLKLSFNKTIDMNYTPKITLIVNSRNKIPVSEHGGYFASENGINNVYFSPNISLNDSLAGTVDFEIENAIDLSGNKMILTPLTGFTYDIQPTEIKSAVIKEGANTNKKEIHILTNVIKGNSIQISENPSFPENVWIKYSNNIPFVLSSASGQKQVYIRIRDAEGNMSKTVGLKTNLDITKPNVIYYKYPMPVTLDTTLTISVVFDESIDTAIAPDIILVSTGTENPVVPKEGTFSKSNAVNGFENDTYTTGPIKLSPGMGGAITIIVKNASDISGNIMDITSQETFQLDTFPPTLIKFSAEREYLNENKVNLNISANDADYILLSENENPDITSETTSAQWNSYIDFTSFSLSKGQGRKKIYLKLKDMFGNISSAFKTEVVVDNVSPQILFHKLQFNPDNSSIIISFIFNETMDISREPQISFIGSGEHTPKVPAGGTFLTNLIQNDTYTTPPVDLNENMTGEIIIVVNEAYDLAGNSISTTARASFFYSPIFPKITAVIPMEENFTFTDWINLYIYAYNAKNIMVSENPSFPNGAWLDFSENVHLGLSKNLAEKTIYFKFKDANGNISYTTNFKIEKIAPPKDFVENSEKIEISPQDTTATREITIKNKFGNFIFQMISENPFWKNTKWEPYSAETNYVLSSGYGDKLIYLWFRDEIGNYSDIFCKKIFLNISVPADKSSLMQKVSEGLTTTKDLIINFPEQTIDVTQKVINLPIAAIKKVTQAILPPKTDTALQKETETTAVDAKPRDTTGIAYSISKLPARGLEIAAGLPEQTIDITQKIINLPIDAVKKATHTVFSSKTDTTALNKPDTTAVSIAIQDTTKTELNKTFISKTADSAEQKTFETAAVKFETKITVDDKQKKFETTAVSITVQDTAKTELYKPVISKTADSTEQKTFETAAVKSEKVWQLTLLQKKQPETTAVQVKTQDTVKIEPVKPVETKTSDTLKQKTFETAAVKQDTAKTTDIADKKQPETTAVSITVPETSSKLADSTKQKTFETAAAESKTEWQLTLLQKKQPETTAVQIKTPDIGKTETAETKQADTLKQKTFETAAAKAETAKTTDTSFQKELETTSAKSETAKAFDSSSLKGPETTQDKKDENVVSYIAPRKIKQIWTVEVTSDKDKVWASNFMDKINKSDPRNHAYIKKVIVNGMIWYTIRAGLFNDEKEAKQLGENLKAKFEEIKEYNIVLVK